ncbi:MAG: hypothetical protein LBE84_10565 [Planctomycetota bacterium]|jgi:hypothetical protein|nr:hypothetical protein [Planctomycetota bacterium]
MQNQNPLPSGLIQGNLSGYAFYEASDTAIESKIEAVRAAIAKPFTEPDALTVRRGWRLTERYFFLFDAVSLAKFIDEFDCYSYHCLSGASYVFMTETEADSAKRESVISDRRNELIRTLKVAARKGSDIFFSGADLLADGPGSAEDYKNSVWLAIGALSVWLVRQSDLPSEWVPSSIFHWVADNAPAGKGGDVPAGVQASEEPDPAPAKAAVPDDLHPAVVPGRGDATPKVVCEFNDRNELVALSVNGRHITTGGRFSWAARLIDTLSKSSGQKMLKTHFDRIHPDVRGKAKQQLGDRIGWNVLPTVYNDDGDSIELTDAISVKRV